jgi:hypothetical protein
MRKVNNIHQFSNQWYPCGISGLGYDISKHNY